MTAQAAETKKAPFCDNPKCNFHRVAVSESCISLEHGEIKVTREFFGRDKTLKVIKLCGTCAEVVPMFVRCKEETVIDGPTIWMPGEKQVITNASVTP